MGKCCSREKELIPPDDLLQLKSIFEDVQRVEDKSKKSAGYKIRMTYLYLYIKKNFLLDLEEQIHKLDLGQNNPRKVSNLSYNYVKDLTSSLNKKKEKISQQKRLIDAELANLKPQINPSNRAGKNGPQYNQSKFSTREQQFKRPEIVRQIEPVQATQVIKKQSHSAIQSSVNTNWNPSYESYSLTKSNLEGLKEVYNFSKANAESIFNSTQATQANRQKQLSELKMQIRKLQSEFSKLQNENKAKDEEKSRYQQLSRSLQQDIKVLKQQQLKLSDQNDFLKKRVQELRGQLQQKTRNLQKNQQLKQIELTRSSVAKPIVSIARQTRQAQVQTSKHDSLSNDPLQYQPLLRLFYHSNILPAYPQIKNGLKIRNDLSSLFPNKIIQTKLLYAFDNVNILHFKDYIQNHQNLVLLIDMGNGMTVGGFAGKIQEEDQVSGTFLFSLNAQRAPIKLTTMQPVKKINYDPSYINFGNGQLKITGRTLNLFSNIGGFSCNYYNNRKRASILDFLGGEKREWKIKHYEIHEVFFDSKNNSLIN